MKTMTTGFWEKLGDEESPAGVDLLVFRGAPTIEEFLDEVKRVGPSLIIPPFQVVDAKWSSRAAERARSVTTTKCGAVICGASDVERMDYFVWAQGQGFWPLVLLPHLRKTRNRQVMDLVIQGYVNPETLIHLPGNLAGFTQSSFSPIRFSTGDAF